MTLPTTANVSRPVAEGYGALLTYGSGSNENLYLQVATAQGGIERRTGQAESGRPNLAANPEDFRSENGLMFSRSQFSGGEGLDRAHRPGGSEVDSSRYWDSKHVAIAPARPGELEMLSLGWDTEAITGTSSTAPRAVRVADGTRVFWTDGATVKWTNNILAATPAVTTENPGTLSTEGSQNVTAVALDGRTLYAALNGAGSVHKRTWAGTWTAWSDLQPTNLWVVKRRVIAAVGSTLYDAAAGAGSVVVKELSPDDSWTAVIDAGHLILAAATDGLIYAFSDEGGTLIIRGETPMQSGEVCYSMAWADGLLLLGVGDENMAGGKIGRLYGAQLSGVRVVGTRLMREWGTAASTVDHSPRAMSVGRDEILVPAIDTGGTQAVWAYIRATAGIYRRTATTATTVIRHCYDIDGKVVAWRAGADIVRETSTYAATGHWVSPFVDWYSAALKSVVGLRIESADIPAAGGSISLYYSTNRDALLDTEHASWVLAKTLTFTDDKSVAEEIPLLEVSGRGVALMLVLARSTATTHTPQIWAVAARAFENTEDVTITIPVNVSDLIERPGKIPLRVPGRGREVYAALRDREGTSGQVEILRTGEIIKGRVEHLAAAVPYITPRGSSILAANLTVRGVKVA